MKHDSEEFDRASEPHLAEEDLISYHRGRLREATREYVQYHLLECDNCLAAFNDVRDFFDSHREGEKLIKEDVASEWRTFWGRVKADEVAAHVPVRRPEGFRLNSAAVFAAVGIILAALVVPGIWAIRVRQERERLARQLETEQQLTSQLQGEQENREVRVKQLEQENLNLQEQVRTLEQNPRSQQAELRQPEVNVPIYDLYSREAVRRSGEGSDMNRVRILSAAKSFMLILNGEGLSAHPSYAIEILDGKGQVVWRGSGLRRDNSGNFMIMMDRAFLHQETYRLKLYGQGGRASQQIVEYVMRIE